MQLGKTDFSKSMQISDHVEWNYEPGLSLANGKDFDVAILDREISADECDFLIRFLRAYTLFVTETVPREEGGAIQRLIVRKKGKRISAEELSILLKDELPDYFSESYGEKYGQTDLSVAQGFNGTVSWKGFEKVDLSGDFGNELTQIVFWRNNIPVLENQAIEFWLEYAKDASVEILLEITVFQFGYGTIPESEEVWTFTEKDLEDLVFIENRSAGRKFLFASVKARGKGNLSIIALHDRYSRRGKGNFIPGGKRSVTSDREEVFYYFDPGSLEPPLNVYFSGYKRKEGFEGYGMLRGLGHPFLLITDARLEGGGAYMGSKEYEDAIEQILRSHMEELGFQSSEVNIA